MGQKDITEKILEDYNDVFADIINGLLFDGVQEIKPEDLENTTVHAQYKAEDGKVHELERDIAKYWKEEKVELAICGIENQSKVEKNMPFRIVGYDGAAYRSQLQQERKRMLPVVTIVLYFGTDRHWNSKKKIKELMEIPRFVRGAALTKRSVAKRKGNSGIFKAKLKCEENKVWYGRAYIIYTDGETTYTKYSEIIRYPQQ